MHCTSGYGWLLQVCKKEGKKIQNVVFTYLGGVKVAVLEPFPTLFILRSCSVEKRGRWEVKRDQYL